MYEYPKDGDLEEVKLELTKDCTLSCVHCSSNASPGNRIQLPRDTVLSVISQAKELNAKSIAFSGGEPLLWPWLKEAVRSCNVSELNCSLYSTGINQAGDGAKEIMTLCKNGLGKVIFSIYSPIKDSHEAIT